LKAAHEQGKRLQFEVADQKDELDWLLTELLVFAWIL
jgi:hypothetical protein